MTIQNITAWAVRKGIGLVATGDWTHPMWMREIEANLEEAGTGLLKLKHAEVAKENFDASSVAGSISPPSQSLKASEAAQNFIGSPHAGVKPLFLLATEVSSIYSQGGKVRRVHTLIWVPTLDTANKINKEMTKRGCNLLSDGRPIVGLTCIQLAELVLSIDPHALVIPSHAWTPWFSVYGSLGGFDSIDEAYGPFAKYIYAVETGLSSSPSMNWRIKELDHRSIVSSSDAHSGPKLGREATVFDVPEGQLGYEAIYQSIKGSVGSNREAGIRKDESGGKDNKTQNSRFQIPDSRFRIAYTIEFYPEEGKYHYTGHRACNIRYSPLEMKEKGSTCPVCGKPLTVGVMQRVEDLALRQAQGKPFDPSKTLGKPTQGESLRQPVGGSGQTGRREEDLRLIKFQMEGVYGVFTRSKTFPHRPPFIMLVPLQEIIAEAVEAPVTSPKVQTPYCRLTETFGSEFAVLLATKTQDIARAAGERVAQGVEKVRTGDIKVDPGYDGVFGVVKIWKAGEEKPLLDTSKEQLSIF